jgi:hypothetical protein
MNELIKRFENACGKKVKETIEFKADGTFKAFYAAEKRARELGYTTGSMCRNEPIAMGKDFEYIAKWYNIEPSERHRIEAGILSEDFREGDVIIAIFE